MNNFTLEIWDDECPKVIFYTIRKEGAAYSEVESFFSKLYTKKEHKYNVRKLMMHLILNIGTNFGAIDAFFSRVERNVIALPHRGNVKIEQLSFGFNSFPLRLFAMRIMNRTDIVILFNGGVKTARTMQESEELSLKFYEAQTYSRIITEAFIDSIIEIDEKTSRIKDYNGNEMIQF